MRDSYSVWCSSFLKKLQSKLLWLREGKDKQFAQGYSKVSDRAELTSFWSLIPTLTPTPCLLGCNLSNCGDVVSHSLHVQYDIDYCVSLCFCFIPSCCSARRGNSRVPQSLLLEWQTGDLSLIHKMVVLRSLEGERKSSFCQWIHEG